MLKNPRNRTIALAGVYQACAMVHDIAMNGRDLNNVVQSTINTLFNTDPESVEQVYGGLQGVSNGIRIVIDQLGLEPAATRRIEITRYALALLYLERKLTKNAKIMDVLASGIQAAKQQSEYFGSPVHDNVIANLADLYQRTVSQLKPRVMVTGPAIVHQTDTSSLIRSLLLAGMRSAILWRQCGGRKLQLLFGRKKLINTSQDLLEESFANTD